MRHLYRWPKRDTQVHCAIQNCLLCQINDETAACCHGPMQPVPLPSIAWSNFGGDIVGPYASHDDRFVFTLIDESGKWPEVTCIHTTTNESVRKFLIFVVGPEGFPGNIITDPGT